MVSKRQVGGLQVNRALERSQPGPGSCLAGYFVGTELRDVYPLGPGLVKVVLGEESNYTSVLQRENEDTETDLQTGMFENVLALGF